MSFGYFFMVGVCLCIARHFVNAEDLTLKSGEDGDEVIDATIRKIQTSCVLAANNYFLRRVAAVNLKNASYSTGGPWRVTTNQLKTVKQACTLTLKSKCNEIKGNFFIDVTQLLGSQLDIPLYSGIVMSLFIMNIGSPIPVSKSNQADYWYTNIRTDGAKADFLQSANDLEKSSDCSASAMDLVFVIDSSGSVGLSNFNKTLTFLVNIITAMDIGAEQARVGVIRFSSSPVVSFALNSYSTKSAVVNAVKKIGYNGGGTATHLALDLARTSGFTVLREGKASKVLVLVTDGKSNNETATVAAAKKLKDQGIIIYTIGVVNPRVSELKSSASEPSCTHFINLKDYDEIDFIVKEIQSESCKAPIVTEEDEEIIDVHVPDNGTKIQTVVTTTNNETTSITILVTVNCAGVTVYAAMNNSFPSIADYTYKVTVTDGQIGKIVAQKQANSDKLSITIYSKKNTNINCSNSSYNVTLTSTSSCTEANRKKSLYKFEIPSNKSQYIQCDNIGQFTVGSCSSPATFFFAEQCCIANPCTKEAREKPLFYFQHPCNKAKFLQCDAFGQMFIMSCQKSLFFNSKSLTCTRYPRVKLCSPAITQRYGNLLPHPLDKTKYIACTSSESYYIMNCPESLVWDQSIRGCNYPKP